MSARYYELAQVNGGKVSWWNDTYEPSFCVPSTDDILSAAGNFALGSSLGLSKDAIIGLSPRQNGRLPWPNRSVVKALGIAGAILSIGTLSLDIANIWTEDGYTNGDRVVKTGVLVLEAGSNAVLGVIAGEAVKYACITLTTPYAVIAIILIGGLILAVGGYGAHGVSERLYRQYLDWRTSGNLYKDPYLKIK